MRVVLAYALVALAASKPRQETPQYRQWPTAAPQTADRRPQVPVDDHFEYRNPDTTDEGLPLFESDMVLTAAQRAPGADRQSVLVTRLWTSPVAYAISSSSAADRVAIEAAIQHWRDNSCLEFSEVAEGASEKHINFIKSSGCWSYVGKLSGSGGQSLSIGSGCTGLGTVVHEIGHAIGLYHQQSRTDRDGYVEILYENIQSGRQGNFAIASSSTNRSVPYDLTSNMHYGATYFTSNGLNTIQVRNFLHERLIGNRGGLSHRDRHIANLMYQCAATCTAPPTCQNGGFVGEACTCVCPGNTAGSNCETLNGDYYGDVDCGDLNMNAAGTITSPNYPSNFPRNVVCYWVITAGAGEQVKVTITDMKMLYRYSDGNCYWDFLMLRHTGNDYVNDEKACDEELTGQSFTSTGNRFIVIFNSGNYGRHRGFSASVEFLTGAATTAAPAGNCGGARRH